ncbi:hypothetical protein HNQ79_004673 [Streptomyces candidus]|uniref:Uncharacterized protein n=1 Tax=Streptomyces candidus TaxID=67283 RepID=A0A7X0HKS4_9ACTN|nr:hypothetical protein [Streptomyces candidus]
MALGNLRDTSDLSVVDAWGDRRRSIALTAVRLSHTKLAEAPYTQGQRHPGRLGSLSSMARSLSSSSTATLWKMV